MFPHWGNAFYPFSSVGHLFYQCFGRALGNQRAHWVLSLSKCHDRLFPQCSGRALGDKGLLDFIPFKVGFLCPQCPGRALGEQRAPRVLSIFRRHDPLYLVALPEHWGNQGPLGFYPLKVEHLFPQLPVRALGGQTAPWSLSCWQLTSDQLVPACLS